MMNDSPPRTGISQLSVYRYDGCFFCYRVQQATERLALAIEERDILRDRDHCDALLQARGRRTVPVLRIDYHSGESVWLPESQDIIEFLEQVAAAGI